MTIEEIVIQEMKTARAILDRLCPEAVRWIDQAERNILFRLEQMNNQKENHVPKHSGTSVLCEALLHIVVPVAVCYSNNGYFIGVVVTEQIAKDHPSEGYMLGEALSRDSVEYWDTEKGAAISLAAGRWTQRPTP